jgi:hypothetical protein
MSVAEYELGKYYRVPAVLVNEWRGFEGWIPVMGPMHEDAEIVNFPWQHFHVDWRFVRADIWNTWKDWRVPGGHFGTPVQCPDTRGAKVIDRGPELRLMKYKRDPGPFPDRGTSWVHLLRKKFACAKLINGTCPHRGIPVSAMRRDGDILTCPGHGLRWNAITGAAVPTSDNSTSEPA